MKNKIANILDTLNLYNLIEGFCFLTVTINVKYWNTIIVPNNSLLLFQRISIMKIFNVELRNYLKFELELYSASLV